MKKHEQKEVKAKIIAEHIGDSGDTYRIGGDEFAAILVGQKQPVINNILESLNKEKRYVLQKYHFTCAFGAATFTPGVDKSLNDLEKRADDLMNKAKSEQKQCR